MKFIWGGQAIESIRLRKGRVLFGGMGIAVACSSVLTVASIVNTISVDSRHRLDKLGVNAIFVRPKAASERAGFKKVLGLRDIETLRAELSPVATITPDLTASIEASACGDSTPVVLSGVDAAGFRAADWRVTRATITAGQTSFDGLNRIAVVGEGVVKSLPCLTKLPHDLIVGRHVFRVEGVLSSRRESRDASLDSLVVIPALALEQDFGEFLRPATFRVNPRQGANSALSIDNVQTAVRKAHGLRSGDDDDFQVVRQSELIAELAQASSQARRRLLVVLGWAFVLGGVCVANSVSMSVIERRSEIGVRRAVGARRNEILLQFLTEGGLVSLLGAVVGVALACPAAASISKHWLEMSPSIDWMMMAFLIPFCAFLGIAGAAVPAFRAAEIAPSVAVELS